uniref:Uncharacterized protein n=1 Tax=Cacopsylla melanoneura TaxID=428564 RepID=A0A8D8UFD2_9HEMI
MECSCMMDKRMTVTLLLNCSRDASESVTTWGTIRYPPCIVSRWSQTASITRSNCWPFVRTSRCVSTMVWRGPLLTKGLANTSGYCPLCMSGGYPRTRVRRPSLTGT